MAPTPEEVDAAGSVLVNVDGHSVWLSTYRGPTYQTLAIAPGRWYHVTGADGISYGLVDCSTDGEVYAFDNASLGQALGAALPTLYDGAKYLVSRYHNEY